MQSTILEVNITKSMDRRAEFKSSMHGDIKNSIRRGKGNLVGYLGEEIVLATVDECVEHNTFNYDMVRFPETDFTYTIDVKTKERTVEPKPYYTCHVAKTSLHQNVNVYVFCQVNVKNGPRRGWILGWMQKDDYLKQSTFMAAGEMDSFGWENRVDGYVLEIAKLHPISEL
jgi:hypothetical protein